MSSSSDESQKNEKIENSSEDGLQDLLRQLHGQIRSSNWLESNTANKLEQENPELIKAWKDAVVEVDSKK